MKNLSKTILALLATGVIGCALFTEQAQAVPITGSVAFLGAASASGASNGGATTITFTNPWNVVGGIGDYSGVPLGTDATFTPFTFTGDGSGATLSAAVIPLWAFMVGGDTYWFDLLSLTSGHSDAVGIAFTGSGVAHITGLDDRDATWALSGSSAGGFTFMFSTSTTTTNEVPDGGSAVALLGIALVGLEGLRRKLRA